MKTVLVETFEDNRSCTPPACSASAACPSKLELFSDGQCAQLAATVAPGSCKDVAFGSYRAALINGGNAEVTCTKKNGGDVQGTIELTKRTTLCCVP